MVTNPVAIPLPVTYLHRTAGVKEKETAPRAEKTRLKVDKVIVREIEDYYQLRMVQGL